MTFDSWLVAVEYLTWLPVLPTRAALLVVVACVLVWIVLRCVWGPSHRAAHLGLWCLRLISLAVLIAILFGPTIVDEQAGETSRPKLIYLYDGSQSMQLGRTMSRWESSLSFVDQAQASAGVVGSQDVQSFRFGHRLEPMRNSTNSDMPDQTDSRLGDALRQLMPQVSSKSTAGVVILSDGRVRATESVERTAANFRNFNVPIHVVPIGAAEGNGDIAIVSLVMPPSVRKYTENELQCFIRSFGMDGRGTNVRIVRPATDGATEATTLTSVPITLQGGPQSVSLNFRATDDSEELQVVVDPIDGELTDRNNMVSASVEVDRSPIRVLYLQDDASVGVVSTVLSQRQLSFSQSIGNYQDIFNLRDALQVDQDIRCITLISESGRLPVNKDPDTVFYTFPKTRGELFAFDCIIMSDLGPNVMEPQHCQWLRQWVEERGGGLVLTGPNALKFKAWEDSQLISLLPVLIDKAKVVPPSMLDIELTDQQHPIWQIRLAEKLNEQILNAFPQMSIECEGIVAKPDADVLARVQATNDPVLVAHRFGRGRVIASTAPLSNKALTELSAKWGAGSEGIAGKLWRNIVYWATEGSATARRRLMAKPDKRFYRPGEKLSVTALAYDEQAKKTTGYDIWAMFEPAAMDDESLYSPIMWPDGVARDSGEVSPRLAWGEEIMLHRNPNDDSYRLDLNLSETAGDGDNRMRIELTAYETNSTESTWNHGSQVDSSSLMIQVLSDPFEQQNPLPNHELLRQLATLSGGSVLQEPEELSDLLTKRNVTVGAPDRTFTPAWSKLWLWSVLVMSLSAEWIWRRMTGLA